MRCLTFVSLSCAYCVVQCFVCVLCSAAVSPLVLYVSDERVRVRVCYQSTGSPLFLFHCFPFSVASSDFTWDLKARLQIPQLSFYIVTNFIARGDNKITFDPY